MRLNVLYELRQSIGSTSEYDLDEPRLLIDSLELTSLHGTVGFLRTDRGLLATVSADAIEATACSRCAKVIDVVLNIAFKEEYIPYTDPRTGSRVRVHEGEDVFRIDDDYVLDLTEAIGQYILTAEPLKPMCRPECAGLCPECGADWNETSCDCSTPVDERLAILAALKRETEGE